MKTVSIVPTLPSHIDRLGRSLRANDEREITCLGLNPHRMLWRSYRVALWRETVLIDGEVAAIGGVGGTALGIVGRPWMLTSPIAETISPLSFVRIFKQEVAQMLQLFPVLTNYVHAEYQGAVRLLELAGFTLDEPVPFGSPGVLFRRFHLEVAHAGH